MKHEIPALLSIARRQEENIANKLHREYGGHRVRIYYRDRCCEGADHPEQAVFFLIFRDLLGIKGDFWHRLNDLTKGLDSSEPGLISQILSRISKETFDKHNVDLNDVAELLKRCKKAGKGVKSGIKVTHSDYYLEAKLPKYKELVRDSIPGGKELGCRYRKAFQDLLKEAEARKKDGKSTGWKETVVDAAGNVLIKGFDEFWNSFLFHAERGCWSDGMPVASMFEKIGKKYVAADPEKKGANAYLRGRGTGPAESNNSITNRVADHVSWIGEEKAGWHTLKMIARINKRIDIYHTIDEDEDEDGGDQRDQQYVVPSKDEQEDGEPFVWRVHEINERMRDLVKAVPFPRVRAPTTGRDEKDLLFGFKFRDVHAHGNAEARIAELRERHAASSRSRFGGSAQRACGHTVQDMCTHVHISIYAHVYMPIHMSAHMSTHYTHVHTHV